MKSKEHLSLYGVGPIYGGIVVITTLIALINRNHPLIYHGIIPALKLPLMVTGISLIVAGILIWVKAVLIDRIDDYITTNQLKTDGVYGCVRNPIYTAILFVTTGILMISGQVYFLVLPVFYYLILTVLLKRTEEKWLLSLYGQDYADYCRTVNRIIPDVPHKDTSYISTISDARWIIYDLIGNAGWIIYFVYLIKCLKLQVTGWHLLLVMPALLMVNGLIELIHERVLHLSRELSYGRLMHGFGALILGGLLASILSGCGACYDFINGSINYDYLWMCLGGILCALNSALIMKTFKIKA